MCAENSASDAGLRRLLEVQRHRVQQLHLVSALPQPGGVVPGPAAHVGDPGGRRRQEPLHEAPGPVALERVGLQAFALTAGVVVAPDRFVEVGHARSLRAARLPRQVVR